MRGCSFLFGYNLQTFLVEHTKLTRFSEVFQQPKTIHNFYNLPEARSELGHVMTDGLTVIILLCLHVWFLFLII